MPCDATFDLFEKKKHRRIRSEKIVCNPMSINRKNLELERMCIIVSVAIIMGALQPPFVYTITYQMT